MSTSTYRKPEPFSPQPVPSGSGTTGQWLAALVAAVHRSIRPLFEQPALDFVLIEGVALATGGTVLVAHGLGRRFRGWRVADVNASATIYRASSSSDPALYLPLVTSANCTVSLEVF